MRISDWSSDVCSSDLTDEGDDVSTATPRETDKPGPIGSCPEPINSAPQHHFVAGAAIRALNQWLVDGTAPRSAPRIQRSEEHTSELQSLMRISYAVFCLKKKKK